MTAPDRSQPVPPMMPGMPERRTRACARHGVTSLFAASSIAGGTVICELHRQHQPVEFRNFLTAIDKAVPTGLDVHPVCCMAASQVRDSSGRAHVSITVGHATDKKSPIRCIDAVPAVISCARPRPGCPGAPRSHPSPPGYNNAARPPAGRSSRNRTHQSYASQSYASYGPAAPGRYGTPAAGRTRGSPRSAHNRCTRIHRGPVGSHATVTWSHPFTRACAAAQSSAWPSRNAFTLTASRASTKPVLPHQEGVPVSNMYLLNNGL